MKVVGQVVRFWVLAMMKGSFRNPPGLIFNKAKITKSALAFGLKFVQNGILQATKVLQYGFDGKGYVRGCISKSVNAFK